VKKYFHPVFIYLLLSAAACSKKNLPQTIPLVNRLPDYSLLKDWAAHPQMKDPSDQVPKSLQKNYIKDSTVDVFFLHPTTFTTVEKDGGNADLDDINLNNKTDKGPILYQASVFNESCRVFAPRYRQAHYGNYFTKDTAAAKRSFDLAYADVKAAFEYYYKNFNGGRPIIIAAHSQGTNHAARLLKELFEGQPLYNKLVVAYLVGMPSPGDYFEKIPACKDSFNTGCFVGWRSFKKGTEGPAYIKQEKYNSIVTNPLLWDTSYKFAHRKLNTGGILKNFNKMRPGVVSAQVHNNILWTSKPKFFGNFLLRRRNYHIGDINLFYNNIRMDVKRRIGLYWKQ
jgi:hypothetical protein